MIKLPRLVYLNQLAFSLLEVLIALAITSMCVLGLMLQLTSAIKQARIDYQITLRVLDIKEG